MQDDDLESAFLVFTLNTKLFPNSFNVWDSQGGCSYNMKGCNLSLRCYKTSVELNPDNENGRKMIERNTAE